MSTAAPPELAVLGERLAPLSDLHALGALAFWDQNTMMPPRGAPARADMQATLERIAHEHLTDPAIGRLLDALDGWIAGADPDSEEVRMVRAARRDFEKAVRVPTDLAAEMSRAASLGQQAWLEARAASDYRLVRDALARHVELRHRYVECFEGYEHPYDVVLDDFEPEMTTAQLRPLLDDLRDALVELVVAHADDPGAPRDDPLAGPWEPDVQRAAVLDVLEALGFEPEGWRLDTTAHPFAQGLDPGDIRITTRFAPQEFTMAFYAALHEFGHGLYEAQIPRRLVRSPLGNVVSLGVHESQSRMWENLVGRSRPFCTWAAARLARTLPGLKGLDGDRLFDAVNGVRPSLIRVEADETTYNLHVILRFELELALLEGALTVDELPSAWNAGMLRLLGVEVPDDARGVLQDIHWSAGLIGYFPTYTLGNVFAAQLFARASADLGGLDDAFARELLRRATGQELSTEPFLRYLRGKLSALRAPADS